MNNSDNTQPSQDLQQEEQQAAPQTIAKPKRKPRETKKSKVITVSVNPIELFDDQKPPTPPGSEAALKPAAPKTRTKAKSKSKAVAEPVVEPVSEPVAEPLAESSVEPVAESVVEVVAKPNTKATKEEYNQK